VNDADLAGERRELARYLDWRDGTRSDLKLCEVCGALTYAPPPTCSACQHESLAARAAQKGGTP